MPHAASAPKLVVEAERLLKYDDSGRGFAQGDNKCAGLLRVWGAETFVSSVSKGDDACYAKPWILCLLSPSQLRCVPYRPNRAAITAIGVERPGSSDGST